MRPRINRGFPSIMSSAPMFSKYTWRSENTRRQSHIDTRQITFQLPSLGLSRVFKANTVNCHESPTFFQASFLLTLSATPPPPFPPVTVNTTAIIRVQVCEAKEVTFVVRNSGHLLRFFNILCSKDALVGLSHTAENIFNSVGCPTPALPYSLYP